MDVSVKADKLQALLMSGRRYKLAKGQMIQSTEGLKTLNLVHSGYIKRYLIGNDGTLGIQVIYGPGYIFPVTLAFQALLGQDIYEGPEIYYYETMSDTEIFKIDEETLVQNVKKDPMLYRDLFSVAGRRLLSTLHGLENLAMRTSYKRVAHELAFLAHQFGEKRDSGVELQIQLTHQDLANILSVTRETVSTCMVELRDKGLIKTNKVIFIPDLVKLEREAYS
jgi:CRP/FNR family transcriptional regulator